ncbi:DUF5317 domain-containing protein [Aquibacillus albus]|uniref:DUF5317 domain-containing protein n=1 Tax=Aquibacillus albus TaxID=1168171 RepID=A0ABS2N0E9_9BACI|nr:DUF5317 domain-containing protein [Aquibacillus albus]MBM7571589.1 hypothetical protein [Aquibacillus albus]
MVADGIIWSLIVGFFRKGNLKWLAEKKLFKWGWIFPVIFILQFTVFYFQNAIEFIGSISNYLFIFVYIIGLIFLWVNRFQYGISIIFLGVLLNFIVMIVNGGRMPVSEEAANVLDPMYIQALKDGLYGKHMILTETTKLAFLGDIIPITSPYPKSQVISIGDVIMNIGIFLFIQDKMLYRKKSEKESTKVRNLQGGEV